MKVLVIGGTRFIGAAAVRRLVAAGHQVTVFNRGRSKSGPPRGVARIIGDRDRLPAYRRRFGRLAPDVVLHNVVVTEAHARDLVETFSGLCRRVVMTSSMDVYRAYGRLRGSEPGPLEPLPLDETSPLRETRFPLRSDARDRSDRRWDYDKIPAEAVLRGADEVLATVLRLPMVIGPDDFQHRLFPLLRPMLDGRPAIVLQEGYATWRSTYAYVENVGEALARACGDEGAVGRVYNVADGHLSMLELGSRIAREVGWSGEFALVERERLPEVLQVPWRVEQSFVCSAERIRRELGWVPLLSLEEGIARTVAWEREHPPHPTPEGLLNYGAEDAVLADVSGRGRAGEGRTAAPAEPS